MTAAQRPLLIWFTLLFSGLTIISKYSFAQTNIPLPHTSPSDITWTTAEKEYYTKSWNSMAITNVSKPELIMYRPSKNLDNGTSVIIAPGGGIYALSIDSEGRNIAKWLNNKGITAFILKYRLVPTGEDGIQDLINIVNKDNEERIRVTKKVLPYSVEDGLNAVSYIRDNARLLNLKPDKIGFMGFSGGGVILFGLVNSSTKENRPDFLIPVYPGTDLITPMPNKDTPPTLFIAAANDQLIDATIFTGLFNKWHKAGVRTGIHLYTKGGHGFGTWKRGYPSDQWLDRFYEWAISEKFVTEK